MTRYTLAFTKAQLESLRLRFPAGDPRLVEIMARHPKTDSDKLRLYLDLGCEPPARGGQRENAGRKPKKTKG